MIIKRKRKFINGLFAGRMTGLALPKKSTFCVEVSDG
jgi:hypothetical protein